MATGPRWTWATGLRHAQRRSRGSFQPNQDAGGSACWGRSRLSTWSSAPGWRYRPLPHRPRGIGSAAHGLEGSNTAGLPSRPWSTGQLQVSLPINGRRWTNFRRPETAHRQPAVAAGTGLLTQGTFDHGCCNRAAPAQILGRDTALSGRSPPTACQMIVKLISDLLPIRCPRCSDRWARITSEPSRCKAQTR